MELTNWQPIETAPKETPILLYMKYGNCQFACVGSIIKDRTSLFWVSGSDSEFPQDLDDATHWAPLPQPPCSQFANSKLNQDDDSQERGA